MKTSHRMNINRPRQTAGFVPLCRGDLQSVNAALPCSSDGYMLHLNATAHDSALTGKNPEAKRQNNDSCYNKLNVDVHTSHSNVPQVHTQWTCTLSHTHTHTQVMRCAKCHSIWRHADSFVLKGEDINKQVTCPLFNPRAGNIHHRHWLNLSSVGLYNSWLTDIGLSRMSFGLTCCAE